ncbi:MAG: Uma2 family endonuclease [Myxococcales bacterium]|nr:Uma2 family endonuclease [Myxococcales bacterium]
MHAQTQHRTRRFTVDEVLNMIDAGILGEDEPLELIDGELIYVSPQGPPHASLTNNIRDDLFLAYGAGAHVREAKPIIAGDDSLPEPDVAVFRGHRDDYAGRHPRGDECLLAVEVAHTSHSADRAKAAVYAAAGVPVYWLVDLPARRLEVHGEPRPDGRYALVRVLAGDDRVSLPGLDVTWRVGDLFAGFAD